MVRRSYKIVCGLFLVLTSLSSAAKIWSGGRLAQQHQTHLNGYSSSQWCDLPGGGGVTSMCSPMGSERDRLPMPSHGEGVASYRSYMHAMRVDPRASMTTKPRLPRQDHWWNRVLRLPRSRHSSPTQLQMKASGSAPFRIQVVTDIDDTVKSSGGVKLAGVALGGIDTQYTRGVFYPGVFQFSLELANSYLPPGEEPLPVAVLTARAKELKFAIALKEGDKVCSRFRQYGQRAGYQRWGIGEVLYGSVREWILQDLKGARKYDNFNLLLERPELNAAAGGTDLRPAVQTKCVFIGDTGEMDQQAGERMLMDHPDRMAAVFLHVVSDKNPVTLNSLPTSRKSPSSRATRNMSASASKTPVIGGLRENLRFRPGWSRNGVGAPPAGPEPASEGGASVSPRPGTVVELPPDGEINGVPVLFFRTYVGAATKALKHNLLEPAAVLRVVKQAEDDLKNLGVPRASSKWRDLEADLVEARRVANSAQVTQPFKLIGKTAATLIDSALDAVEAATGRVSLST